MTLEQLRIFVAVAEREHVTGAARDINLTQSAVSAAIAALEARYATRLFDRVGRRIELTQAGRLFLTEARAVLARAAAAETVLMDLAGLARGVLSLAASQTVANYWLPPVMHRFRSLHPGIALDLTIRNTEQVAALVRDGGTDLGFVEGEVDEPALAIHAIAEDDLVLVVAPDHPWAGRGAVDLPAFPETLWVLREPGSGTRAMFESALRAVGVAPERLEVALQLPSNEAVRSAVEAGAGATVISGLVSAPSVRAGLLVRLDAALPKRRFLALCHKERYTTKAGQALLGLIGYRPDTGTVSSV